MTSDSFKRPACVLSRIEAKPDQCIPVQFLTKYALYIDLLWLSTLPGLTFLLLSIGVIAHLRF